MIDIGAQNYFINIAVNAIMIVIKTYNYIIYAIGGDNIARFIAHPLFAFGVAHKNPNFGIQSARTMRHGHTAGGRQSMPGRTGANIGKRII